MHIPFNIGSSKMLIYFHANAEDIVLAHELLDYMRSLLRVNIISIEYPGYGLYTEEHQKRFNYSAAPHHLASQNYQFGEVGSPVKNSNFKITDKTPRFGEVT